MTRRRREVLLGATAIAASGGLPAPVIAKGVRELKLVTSWPKGWAALDTSVQRAAQPQATTLDPRLGVGDSVDLAWKRLILGLFWQGGKFHPPGAGGGNVGSAGF